MKKRLSLDRRFSFSQRIPSRTSPIFPRISRSACRSIGVGERFTTARQSPLKYRSSPAAGYTASEGPATSSVSACSMAATAADTVASSSISP